MMPPADLASALAGDETVALVWDRLAPSHRQQYLNWIDEAKQPDTRAKRIAETVERLRAG